MKICIIGAGAIGGLLAARLHHAGENVSIVARGPHLEAIRANGLALMENDGTTITAHVRASDTIADAGPQDLIVLAVKAHQLGAVPKPAVRGEVASRLLRGLDPLASRRAERV